MLRHCSARTGCGDFALRVGRHARLSSLGLVGALAGSSPDVGAALRALSRFLSLNDGASIVSVSVEGEFSSLNYAIYEAGIEGTSEVYQMVSAAACNVLRDLCGAQWSATEVQLPFRTPDDVRPFRDFFRAPLRFDSHRLALVFASRWIDHPLRSADPELHAALSAQAAEFEALASPDLPSQVRRVMRNLLLESKGSIETVRAQLLDAPAHARPAPRCERRFVPHAGGRRSLRSGVPAAPRHDDVRRRDRRKPSLRRRQRLRTRVPPLVGTDADTVA